ncbi:MAG: hypothetical protein V5A52_06610, partial [Halovenus sp.]
YYMGPKFNDCSECGKEFKRMWVSDPRKGYDVLNEGPKAWRIQCKGCGRRITVPKQETIRVSS